MPALPRVRPHRICSHAQPFSSRTIRPLSTRSKQIHPNTRPRLQNSNSSDASPFNSPLLPFQLIRHHGKGPAKHRYKPGLQNWRQYKNDTQLYNALEQLSKIASERHILWMPEPQREEKQALSSPSLQIMESFKSVDDMGMLPGTAVVISRSDWPSLFSLPRQRLKMEYVLLKSKLFDFLSIQVMKAQRGFLNYFRFPASGRRARQSAVALHYQMNQALAEGNMEVLKDYVTRGLRSDLAQLLGERKPGTNFRWQRERVQAELINHRAAPLPGKFTDAEHHKIWVEQAVVRIRSQQVLVEQRYEDFNALHHRRDQGLMKGPVRGHERVNEPGDTERLALTEGEAETEAEKAREMERMRAEEEERQSSSGNFDELFVVTRRVSYRDDGTWKVWGTTGETAIEDWQDIEDPNGAALRAGG